MPNVDHKHRYRAVFPIIEWTKHPVYGDCIGVFEMALNQSQYTVLRPRWWDYGFKTITKTEFDTYLSFGIPLLTGKEDPLHLPTPKPHLILT